MYECRTNRPGRVCIMMKKKGCSFNNQSCLPVVPKCAGCTNTETYQNIIYCSIYLDPTTFWRTQECPMATHTKKEVKEEKPSYRRGKGKGRVIR